MKATLLSNNIEGFRGHASHWKLDPPLDGHEYVIVSAVDAFMSGPETYIFPSTEEPLIANWVELEGSERGYKDNERVLRQLGYELDLSAL